MNYNSLFIFSPSFKPRIWADQLIQTKLYNGIIITLIILNCILLACWDPLDPNAEHKRNQIITYIDFGFLICYTIEMIFNIFIKGLVLHPKSYLRDPWSYLDLFVIIVGWIAIIFTELSGLGPLRAFRALKPLRLISGIPQLRLIIDSVLVSLPFLVGAGLLMAIFFVLFGILGVLLFNGALRYHCVIDDDFDENSCCNQEPGFLGGYECIIGKCELTDENIDFGFFNFDNVFNAWIAIFMVINVEGWSRWCYITMDATNNISAIYYIALIVLGAIFWLNLLLAVISVSMSTVPEPEAKELSFGKLKTIWRAFKKLMQRDRSNILYKFCNRIIESKLFEFILLSVIVLNMIVLAMPFRHQPDAYTLTLYIVNLCCLIFFTFEMFLRLTAIGIWRYFSNLLNALDCIIVITGWVEFVIELVSGGGTAISVIRVLRALRLLRVLKLARKWKGLRLVIESIVFTLPRLFFFMILFAVVTATFMLIGIQLFGGQMIFDGEVPRFHFDNIYWAYVTLFVVVTGEQWPDIMFNGMRVHYWAGLIFFVIWKSISTYLLLNLFLSLLIDSFEHARKQRAAAKRKKNGKDGKDGDEDTSNEIEKEGDDKPIELDDYASNRRSKSNEASHTESETSGASSHHENSENSNEQQETAPTQQERKKGHWEVILANPTDKNRNVEEVLFGCLRKDHFPRKPIIAIVRSNIFEWFMIFVVILSCIELVIFEPGYSVTSVKGWIDFSLSLMFAILFTLEMIMRILTFGIVKPKGAYFRNAWDCIDFCVVLVAWVALGLIFLPSKPFLFVAFRAFRAIRILSRFEGTRLVVLVVMESLQVVPHILAISLFFWIIFAIAGLQLFVGQYYYCDSDGEFVSTVDDMDECEEEGFEWKNRPSYFSHIGNAFIAIVRAANVNIPDPLLHGVDVAGEDQNPIRDNHPEYALYWVIFMIVCSWFILGLFLGSIVETFNGILEQRNLGTSIFLTDKQREWIQLQRVLFTLRPKRNSKPGGNSFFRKVIFEVVESREFDFLILLVILVAIGIQCTFHFQQPWTWTLLQLISTIVTTILFTIEAIMKIFGLGFRGYFGRKWNKFDFFVAVISIIDCICILAGVEEASWLGFIKIFRVARILRFLRVVKFSRRVQVLIKSAVLSAATLLNIVIVLLVVFFIFAVLGISFFYDLPQSQDVDDPINRIANWENFWKSCFMCWRLLTGEAWDLVQAEVMEVKPFAGIVWFLFYIFILNLLLMNLIVAVLYENLGLLVSFSFSGKTSVADTNNFMNVWRKFDPYGTKFIAEEDLPKFLIQLRPPLGIGPVSEAVAINVVKELEIPVTRNSKVYFPDVLLALSENLYEVDASDVLVRSVMKGWERAFPENIPVVKGRRRLPLWDPENNDATDAVPINLEKGYPKL